MKQIGILENDVQLAKMLCHFIDSQPEYHCSFYVSTLDDLMDILRKYRKLDLLLLDIELDNKINTLENLPEIKERCGGKVIIITGHNKQEYVGKALYYGASGVYIKGTGLTNLAEAVHAVLNGLVFISPQAATHVCHLLQKTTDKLSPLLTESQLKTKKILDGLNERERSILVRLVKGMRYEDIGKELFISINTVRHYVKILYQKLDVDNKAALSNKTGELMELHQD
jgi:DNA-binding NarL/FixJ family response regulator